MTHRWLDHTAELELEIEAATEEEAFREALAALGELLRPSNSLLLAETVEREIELDAADRGALLADWLNELVYLAERDGFVPADAELRLDGTRLAARVRGPAGPPRPLVKAVTYHGLVFEEVEGGWRARVVFDV